MITIRTQRYEPDGELCGSLITRPETPSRAFTSFMRFELGFGGQVISIEDTQVTVRTQIMGRGRYDITSFDGPVQEMRPLLQGALAYNQARGITHDSDLDATLQACKGLPFLIANAGPLMLSRRPMVAAVASCVAHTLEDAQRLLTINKDDDFFAAAERMLEGHSIQDIL